MAPTSGQQEELEKSLKDLNLSNEELGKFEKAFKDPEFLKLFEDYAKEVSDPKVKAETDLYLRQLEQQGRAEEVYGKGVQLVTPTPGMVFKTKVMECEPCRKPKDPAGKEASGLAVGQKVFVNVCTSDKVDKYSLKDAKDGEGRSGKQLSIPLTLGPKRVGTDKQGQPAAVYDFVVHPESLEFAATHAAALATLAETALEQVEKVSNTRLSRSYRRLNIKYKATEGCTEPPVQAVRTAEGGESMGGRLKPRADVAGVDVPGAKATATEAGAESGVAAAAGKGVGSGGASAGSRSTFSFDRSKAKAGQGQGQQDGGQQAPNSKEPSQAGYRHGDGSVTPEWTLVHRGEADLVAAWGDAGRGLALNTSIPKEVVLRVTLPEVASAAAVDLDVGDRRLALKVPGRYQLDVPLPYAVDETKGKAKFDKARKQLEVTLPVVPPPPPPPLPLPRLVVAADSPATTAPAEGSVPAANGRRREGEEGRMDSEAAAAAAAIVHERIHSDLQGSAVTYGVVSARADVWSGGTASTAPATAAGEGQGQGSAPEGIMQDREQGREQGAVGRATAAEASGSQPAPQQGTARTDGTAVVAEAVPSATGESRASALGTEEESATATATVTWTEGTQSQPQQQRQLTENERKWREIHARQSAEEDSIGPTAGARGDVDGSTAPAAGETAGSAASYAACANGATAATTAVSSVEAGVPTVLLRPRLRHDGALELD